MATNLSLSLPPTPLLPASAPSSKSICARSIAAKFASPARESPFSHCPPLPFCRNLISFLVASYPSSLHLPRGKNAVTRALDDSEASAVVRSDATPPKLPTIWMSDVVAQLKRPYFVNRPWTSEDVVNASFMLVLHGLCLLAPFTFTWKAFGVFVVLYVITGLFGITLSFHRNLSHKSFKLPKYLEYAFAYCGVLAMQGDPLAWVSSHRYHHQHCDTDNDPHSPYEGFWYSHIGWLFDYTSTTKRVGVRGNVGDMAKDSFYQFIQKTYIIHPLLLGVVLYALGGLPVFIWGMVVRTVWVYHITWFVNSAAHVWGSQAWNTGDLSRNNWWVALLAFGEGWHNNHHAFEYSARHGLEWWQLDLTWYCVLALEKMGLATKVRLPTREHMTRLAL